MLLLPSRVLGSMDLLLKCLYILFCVCKACVSCLLQLSFPQPAGRLWSSPPGSPPKAGLGNRSGGWTSPGNTSFAAQAANTSLFISPKAEPLRSRHEKSMMSVAKKIVKYICSHFP